GLCVSAGSDHKGKTKRGQPGHVEPLRGDFPALASPNDSLVTIEKSRRSGRPAAHAGARAGLPAPALTTPVRAQQSTGNSMILVPLFEPEVHNRACREIMRTSRSRHWCSFIRIEFTLVSGRAQCFSEALDDARSCFIGQ